MAKYLIQWIGLDTMYKKFYGFSSDPFRLSPDHRFCLHHPSFTRAKAYMKYALQRGEGFVMITGSPGTGKTTLIDDLLDQTTEAKFNIAKLESAQLEGDDLLRMVSYNYDIPSIGRDKADLLQRLSEVFANNMRRKQRPLLIVDEAQGLSHQALEELRLLTNMRYNGSPLLQIFLVGQEELRGRVTDPCLEQLNQRIVAACHLEPLKPQQIAAYVLHRLRIAGWRGRPRIQREVIPEIARFSGGVPRRINHICSRLLLQGFLEEKEELGEDDIQMVFLELQEEHYSSAKQTASIQLEEFDTSDLKSLAEPEIRKINPQKQKSVESTEEYPTSCDDDASAVKKKLPDSRPGLSILK